MKTIKTAFLTIALGLLILPFSGLKAQDATVAAKNVYKKVLLDNEHVRVLQVEFAPGEVAPWHNHPGHVAYALTDGKLEITDKGKPANVMNIKAGDAVYMPAVTHMAKNVGTTTVRMVVMELKSEKN